MAKALDDTDEKLLSVLRANARLPLVALAQKIGLSRSATQERLRRLETHGVIQGYTVRVADAGPTKLRAWLWVQFAQGFRCADVVPFVLQRPEVRLCHAITGPVDLIVLVEVADGEALSALRDALVGYARIAAVKTAPILTVHFES
jgi:Lrp/AsnC family transcriptional regulator, leucine-responsive regulatory protein